MITREVLGEKLKALRENAFITQKELSFKSGLQANKIIAIEKGRTNYTIDNLLKYINGLGINELVARIYRDGSPVHTSGLEDLLSDTIKITSSGDGGNS